MSWRVRESRNAAAGPGSFRMTRHSSSAPKNGCLLGAWLSRRRCLQRGFHAAGKNGFQDCLGNGAQQEDQRTGRRFFQGLQERVGSLRLHAVRIMNDCHLAAREKGFALNGMLEISNLIDYDTPGLRFGLNRVQVRVGDYALRPRSPSASAATRSASQDFPLPGRTGQQIGMGEPIRATRFAQTSQAPIPLKMA